MIVANNFLLLPTISPAFVIFSGLLTILFSVQWLPYIKKYLMHRSKAIEFAKTLPGPATFPFVGNALLLWETDKTVLTLTRICREIKANTFRFWLGPALKIVVTDPHDLQIIMMSPKGAKKDDVYQLMQPAVVNGLINSEGAIYRNHKRLLTPIINSTAAVERYAEVFNFHARILVQTLDSKVGIGEFNIHNQIGHCIGDIAFETLTGLPGTAQSGEPSPFLQLPQEGLHLMCYRMMRPWLYPDIIYRLTFGGRRFMKIVKDGHHFIDTEIKKKVQEYEPIHMDDPTTLSVIDFLIDHMMKTKELTLEEIRYELLTVFIGLFETMEGLTCMVLLMIAMYPEVQEKVRAEINRTIINDYITVAEVGHLEYLDMVINETLRLYPVAPILPRKITEEMKLTTCTVPKDSSVFMLPYATHRDPKYWEDPEKFIPERFTPENSKKRHPFSFVPFSAGPRVCPGARYGTVSAKIVIAHFLKIYQMTTSMRLDSMQIHTHVSTRSVDGYQITLKKIATNE